MIRLPLVVLVLLTSLAPAEAQGGRSFVLRAPCGEDLPEGFRPALELQLAEPASRVGRAVVVDPASCVERGHRFQLTLVEAEGRESDPIGVLDLGEYRPGLRGRILALWIAAQLALPEPLPPTPTPAPAPRPLVDRAARALGTPSRMPATRPRTRSRSIRVRDARSSASAPLPSPEAVAQEPAQEQGALLLRVSVMGTFVWDVSSAGTGGGADVSVDVGVRGEPGFAGQLIVGGASLSIPEGFGWTELRAALAGLVDVRLAREASVAFGARLGILHEVLTGMPEPSAVVPPLRINDGLEIRASGFASGRFYVYEGLAIVLEVQAGGTLAVPVTNDLAPSGQNGAQLIIRLGLSLD